jgi:hypothetical protein
LDLSQSTPSWAELPPAPTGRYEHQCVAIGHCMLVLGGRTADGPVTDLVDEFDTKSLKWSTCKWKLPEPRTSFAVSYHPVDETLMVYGGAGRDDPTTPPLASYICSMKSISANSEVKWVKLSLLLHILTWHVLQPLRLAMH